MLCSAGRRSENLGVYSNRMSFEGMDFTYFNFCPRLGCNRYRTLFPYQPDPMPSFFRHNSRSRIQNLNLFLRALEVLGGLRSRKEKTVATPPFFGQKIK
jgi:hypothetical protein